MKLLLAMTCFLWTVAAGAQTAWPEYMPGLSTGFSESPVAAVLPADMTITPPAADLPADKARWSGLWQGWACGGALCNVRIAVEKVTDTGATLVYAGGSSTSSLTERSEALFESSELVFRVKTGARLAMRLRAGDEMELSIWRSDG